VAGYLHFFPPFFRANPPRIELYLITLPSLLFLNTRFRARFQSFFFWFFSPVIIWKLERVSVYSGIRFRGSFDFPLFSGGPFLFWSNLTPYLRLYRPLPQHTLRDVPAPTAPTLCIFFPRVFSHHTHPTPPPHPPTFAWHLAATHPPIACYLGRVLVQPPALFTCAPLPFPPHIFCRRGLKPPPSFPSLPCLFPPYGWSKFASTISEPYFPSPLAPSFSPSPLSFPPEVRGVFSLALARLGPLAQCRFFASPPTSIGHFAMEGVFEVRAFVPR